MITARNLNIGDVLIAKHDWSYSERDVHGHETADVNVKDKDVFVVIDIVIGTDDRRDDCITLLYKGHMLTWNRGWSPIDIYLKHPD
jgi:hypothetical protein